MLKAKVVEKFRDNCVLDGFGRETVNNVWFTVFQEDFVMFAIMGSVQHSGFFFVFALQRLYHQ
jgi:hypothetical protein